MMRPPKAPNARPAIGTPTVIHPPLESPAELPVELDAVLDVLPHALRLLHDADNSH